MLLDVIFVVTVTVWLIGLVLTGYLSIEFALAAALVLVALRAVARRFRMRTAVLVFATGVPIAGLLVLANVHGASAAERMGLIGAVSLLAIVLFAFYLMLSGGIGR